MNFKQKLADKISRTIPVRLNILRESYSFCKQLVKYNGSVNTNKNIKKMQYTLLRENHVIEKGMSMKNPRKGFGQKKVKALILRLSEYTDKYYATDKEFLLHPISTIHQYIEYTKANNVEIREIEILYNLLLDKTNYKESELFHSTGIKKAYKKEILKNCNTTFESLLKSRHSIRYFDSKSPSQSLIEKALNLAQLTPSACNRQAWHTHTFWNDKSIDLAKEQGGCKGFENEIKCSILVTADMNAFLSYEIHQAYIDGGLYAMNLINALHSLGLGTIPLSCGFYDYKLNNIKKKFDIPSNESLIVLIGIGNLKDEFNVAESSRKPISLTNQFH
ncbi:MAG: nitroreductase family protein [Paludibacter sp.]|nr:nitroreductase family protein [Paludibacter sp.]